MEFLKNALAKGKEAVVRGVIGSNEQKERNSRATLDQAEKHNKKIEVINAVAHDSHEEWRKTRWREESKTFEPRPKPTTDAGWSERHGGATDVDIANTEYADLPADRQKEVKASIVIAADAVEEAIKTGRPMDEGFINEVAEEIHRQWLDRNRRTANTEQEKSYAELSEPEKEKDRKYARLVIAEWNK
jgi:hypothetical protein